MPSGTTGRTTGRMLLPMVLEVAAAPRYTRGKGSGRDLPGEGDADMRELIALSRVIDRGTRALGRSVAWLVVVCSSHTGGRAIV